MDKEEALKKRADLYKKIVEKETLKLFDLYEKNASDDKIKKQKEIVDDSIDNFDKALKKYNDYDSLEINIYRKY